MANNAPILALPGGSILQLIVMTLPLFVVYCYFLWLAATRPNIMSDSEKFADPRIRLTDILYVYLTTWTLFATLFIYMVWFVNKRRKLSKRYEKEGIVILGDVLYDDQNHYGPFTWIMNYLFRQNDYGYLVYDLEKVANHPACTYEGRLEGKIRKRVRVYYRYAREQISVLVIPKFPFSGQPKMDLEADWASFSENYVVEEGYNEAADDMNRASVKTVMSRDRSWSIIFLSLGWIVFLLFSSIFVCLQIEDIEDIYQDESSKWAWFVLMVTMAGVTPIVAIGGNLLRFKMYERFILKSGKKGKSGDFVGSGGGVIITVGESQRSGRSQSREKGSTKQFEPSSGEDGSYVQMT